MTIVNSFDVWSFKEEHDQCNGIGLIYNLKSKIPLAKLTLQYPLISMYSCYNAERALARSTLAQYTVTLQNTAFVPYKTITAAAKTQIPFNKKSRNRSISQFNKQ